EILEEQRKIDIDCFDVVEAFEEGEVIFFWGRFPVACRITAVEREFADLRKVAPCRKVCRGVCSAETDADTLERVKLADRLGIEVDVLNGVGLDRDDPLQDGDGPSVPKKSTAPLG